MEIKIQRADNGYILEYEECIQVYAESPDYDTDLDALLLLTYGLWDALGYYGSKHDAERLFVVKKKQNNKEE